MGFYSVYTPYVEAPTVRTTTQPVSGGISISAFERLSQGVSVRNPIKRQTSLLPQINSGKTNFVVDQFNFNQGDPRDPASPFLDRSNVTAESFLQGVTDPGVFPLMVGDYLPIDGAIEPLTIRDAAERDSIEYPISHRVRGNIMCGNEDSTNRTDTKGSFIKYKDNSDFVPFEDSADRMGEILLIGYISDPSLDKVFPFDDSALDTRNLTNNGDINEALLDMTGSSDDDFRPINSKASTSGFVYSNNEGTDSIAFGGFLR